MSTLDRYGNIIAQVPGAGGTAGAPSDYAGHPLRNVGSIGFGPPLVLDAVPNGVLALTRNSTVVFRSVQGATVSQIVAPRSDVAILIMRNGGAGPIQVQASESLRLYAGMNMTLETGAAVLLVQIEDGVWQEMNRTAPLDAETLLTRAQEATNAAEAAADAAAAIIADLSALDVGNLLAADAEFEDRLSGVAGQLAAVQTGLGSTQTSIRALSTRVDNDISALTALTGRVRALELLVNDDGDGGTVVQPPPPDTSGLVFNNLVLDVSGGTGDWPYALWGQSGWEYNHAGQVYGFKTWAGSNQFLEFEARHPDVRPGDGNKQTGSIQRADGSYRYRAEVGNDRNPHSASQGAHVVSYHYIPESLPNTWWNKLCQFFDLGFNSPDYSLEDWRGRVTKVILSGGPTGTSFSNGYYEAWQGPRLQEGRIYHIVIRRVQHPTNGAAAMWINGRECFSLQGIPLGLGPNPQSHFKIGAYIWNKADSEFPNLSMNKPFRAKVFNVEQGSGAAGEALLARIQTPLAIPPDFRRAYPMGVYDVTQGVLLTQNGTGGTVVTPPTGGAGGTPIGGNLLEGLNPIGAHDPSTYSGAIHTWDDETLTAILSGTDFSYGSRLVFAVRCTPGKSYQIKGNLDLPIGFKVSSSPSGFPGDIFGMATTTIGRGTGVGYTWTVPETPAGSTPITTMFIRLNRQDPTRATYRGVEVREVDLEAA